MRSKQHRAWVFTLNNYTEQEQEELRRLVEESKVRYMIFGREGKKEGATPHLQGYIYSERKFTLKGLKEKIPALNRSHLEPRLGSHTEAKQYCQKEGDYEESGSPPKSSTKRSRITSTILLGSSLRELTDNELISVYSIPSLYKARSILLNEGQPLTRGSTCGYWIYGPPGVGKSHMVHNLFPGAFVKQQNKWWDGYEGQETVILDDLDSNILGHYLKIWMDKWPARGEIKGGTVPLRHRRFIVTSNYLPSQLWSEDYVLAEAVTRRCTMWTISKRRN